MAARVQMPAPDFRAQAMVNGEFKEVALSDFEGRFLVLFFYPLDFTFVCPTEILAFSDRLDEFERLGVSVVAASVDSPYTHLAWWKTPRKEGGISDTRFPILSDLTKSIAESYGVLLEDGTALRGLFVIDPKGTVRQITINDLAIGRSVDEVLRVIQAIQFADEHGEVCPANWKPGDKTIKPSPSESKEFFSKVK